MDSPGNKVAGVMAEHSVTSVVFSEITHSCGKRASLNALSVKSVMSDTSSDGSSHITNVNGCQLGTSSATSCDRTDSENSAIMNNRLHINTRNNKSCNYGTRISWKEFLRYAKHFINISESIADGWTLCDTNNFNYSSRTNVVTCGSDDDSDIGMLYLVKKCIKIFNKNNTELCDIATSSEIPRNNSSDNNIISFEYHILYNTSYQVPTLYFNVWKRDGSILLLNEFLTLTRSKKLFNQNLHDVSSSYNNVCVITQNEHPILRRPFYYVHPCDTLNILNYYNAIIVDDALISDEEKDEICIHKSYVSNIKKLGYKNNVKNVNPLIMWLSTIAVDVCIDMPSEYGLVV